jgi:hypothetical protein
MAGLRRLENDPNAPEKSGAFIFERLAMRNIYTRAESWLIFIGLLIGTSLSMWTTVVVINWIFPDG